MVQLTTQTKYVRRACLRVHQREIWTRDGLCMYLEGWHSPHDAAKIWRRVMQVTAPGGFHSSRVRGFDYPAKIRSTAIESDTYKNYPSFSIIACEELAGLAVRTLMLEWYDVKMVATHGDLGLRKSLTTNCVFYFISSSLVGTRGRIHDYFPLHVAHQIPSIINPRRRAHHIHVDSATRDFLQLLHGSNVSGLDVVLELLDLLLKIANRDLLVLDNEVDLELADTETNGDELGGTPGKTILLNGTDTSLKSLHVGLVI